ncbi:MAG: hypothetical protein J0H62_08835, partial [Rhizobiales bacterium]|nr:hypothetical protein [Hyphomicrobiales bacterium]
MDLTSVDTIDRYGDPLTFKLRDATGPSPLLGAEGSDTIKVEARQMAGHQKEAVVTDGITGAVWRMTSDEGTHLTGTDLAPFPLGFFNAGFTGDLHRRILQIAEQRSIAISDIEIELVNHYWLTGSFVQGTGEGHAEPTDIEVRIASPAGTREVEALVAAALDASPAVALQRQALGDNTFALYINGRRRTVAAGGKAAAAPSGLALLSAGISFCYMTQLSRYIENMKFDIGGVRLVQFNPFRAAAKAEALPIDTHLFLNGA